jgi:hypothetical protein
MASSAELRVRLITSVLRLQSMVKATNEAMNITFAAAGPDDTGLREMAMETVVNALADVKKLAEEGGRAAERK